jgi:hypothetical protein
MFTVITCWSEQYSVLQYRKLTDARDMFNAALNRPALRMIALYGKGGKLIDSHWRN